MADILAKACQIAEIVEDSDNSLFDHADTLGTPPVDHTGPSYSVGDSQENGGENGDMDMENVEKGDETQMEVEEEEISSGYVAPPNSPVMPTNSPPKGGLNLLGEAISRMEVHQVEVSF
jgi:hypothetical protein